MKRRNSPKPAQNAPGSTFALPPAHPGYQYSAPRWVRVRCADGVIRECFEMDGGKLAEMAHAHLIGKPIE